MAHKYPLTLDATEMATIRFVASRGYCVALYEALMHEDTLCEPADPGDTFYVPEHLAWTVQDELDTNGGHGFGPIGGALEAKLYAFADGIV